MTYDQWKTTDPRDDGLTCDLCGGWLSRGFPLFGWFCPECEPEDEYYQTQIDEQEERNDENF